MSARKFREWLDAVRKLLNGKGGRVPAMASVILVDREGVAYPPTRRVVLSAKSPSAE